MTRIEKLRERLAKANLSQVAELAGVTGQALRLIRDGDTRNPGILTVEAAENALDQLDQQPAATG
jgi:transcriptional regulator with XRE-family HTH domain